MHRIGVFAVSLVVLALAAAEPARAQMEILSIEPDRAAAGSTIDITITGGADCVFDAFLSEVAFSPASGVTHSDGELAGPNGLTVTIDIPDDAPLGPQTVTVTTYGIACVGVDMFEINCADCDQPALVAIEPAQAAAGSTVDVTITGSQTHFDADTQLAFSGSGITVESLNAVDATRLDARLSLAADAAAGTRSITATTGDEVAEGADLFTVIEQQWELAPDSGQQGALLPTVTLTGGGGMSAVSGADLGAGVAIGSLSAPDDATLVLADVAIAVDARVGRRDLTLQLPDGPQVLADLFAVLQGPDTLLLSIDPDHGDRGHPGLAVAVVGQNTHFSAERVFLEVSGSGVVGAVEEAADDTHLQGRLVIAPSATEGPHDVAVQVGGACDLLVPAPCERPVLADGFTVTAPGSLDSAEPDLFTPGESVEVALQATDGQFAAELTELVFDPAEGIEVSSLSVDGPNALRAQLAIADDAPGDVRDVRAVTGTEVALGLELIDIHNPQIRALRPAHAEQGRSGLRVEVAGVDIPFSAETEVAFSGTGITVATVDFEPERPDQVTATIDVTEDAPTGLRDVTVRGADFELTAAGAFRVMPPSRGDGGCGCGGRAATGVPPGAGWALFGVWLLLTTRRRR
jgi:hypothetical protein